MEDILLGLILIAILVIVQVAQQPKFNQHDMVDIVERGNVVEVCGKEKEHSKSYGQLCSEILETYKGNYNDKRERLVSLLVELSEVDDTSEFMENFPQIHEFIFDINSAGT